MLHFSPPLLAFTISPACRAAVITSLLGGQGDQHRAVVGLRPVGVGAVQIDARLRGVGVHPGLEVAHGVGGLGGGRGALGANQLASAPASSGGRGAVRLCCGGGALVVVTARSGDQRESNQRSCDPYGPSVTHVLFASPSPVTWDDVISDTTHALVAAL